MQLKQISRLSRCKDSLRYFQCRQQHAKQLLLFAYFLWSVSCKTSSSSRQKIGFLSLKFICNLILLTSFHSSTNFLAILKHTTKSDTRRIGATVFNDVILRSTFLPIPGTAKRLQLKHKSQRRCV